MAVRFKFRSSLSYDSVQIDGPCITVRDLRVNIIEQKNLKLCQDFELEISDAITGKAYEDDDTPVLEGSSVIIKRVPTGKSNPVVLPCIDTVENQVIERFNFDASPGSPSFANMDADNFDDFGVDLYSAPVPSLLETDSDEVERNSTTKRNAANEVQRLSGSVSKHENIESNDPAETVSKGLLERHGEPACGFGGEAPASSQKAHSKEPLKTDKVEVLKDAGSSLPTMPNAELPSELRCTLCNAIFKGAVMIPCCQHSFCDKCIRSVLIEKAKCPQCSATKCKVDDLLPNLSLRQAIEHFLESQGLISGSDTALPKYAPDGESGIQAKEVSHVVSTLRREQHVPHSSSATGKGSNQITTEFASDIKVRNTGVGAGFAPHVHVDVGHSAPSSSQMVTKLVTKLKENEDRNGAACPPHVKSTSEGRNSAVDYEDSSKPSKLPQSPSHKEEASSTGKRKKKGWLGAIDGGKSFLASTKSKKGDRNCYMCGSPDHLVRDCPAASAPYPMLQTGDAMFPNGFSAYGHSTYWPGAAIPHVRPFTSLYGAPGAMPFDPSMVPVSPYAIPPYMPSIYTGMPVPCGFMRMGSLMPPMVAGADRPLSRVEFMELQGSERRRKLWNEQPQSRELHAQDDAVESSERRYSDAPRKSQDRKPHDVDRDSVRNYSEESDIQRPISKNHREKYFSSDDDGIFSPYKRPEKSRGNGKEHRSYRGSHSEKSNSEKSLSRRSREKHKHHKKGSSKKHREKEDYLKSSNHRRDTSDDRRRDVSDSERHYRKSGGHSSKVEAEPSFSGDRKRRWRVEYEVLNEEVAFQSSRHSKHKVKDEENPSEFDRWEMVDGSDDERQGYYYHKRKRGH
ncbi:E3 ubiquitin ligase PARAQUAT TOLERANCE 3 isoform X1 [Amborella trichopoda]|uniref:E3 ubiquitin ligase PARAQUAT TOLERANCE 3 isoform X1 n=2 Tax=Amborella trichopoda TaxID=13333 RepID=UPI0005D413BC|nr:E3 ubiquitin ligase PARAQUAT TOLERANCE 3 isoform X1 [Amborella trichopoda]|eukprot:XP_011625302.1 E3 ubiquitin ligase PARAQUAT TOLERANCE 3 isoform X1 [Amborella trichopoda]